MSLAESIQLSIDFYISCGYYCILIGLLSTFKLNVTIDMIVSVYHFAICFSSNPSFIVRCSFVLPFLSSYGFIKYFLVFHLILSVDVLAKPYCIF